MKTGLTYNYLEAWTEQILARGKYSFSLSDLRQDLKDYSQIALKFALKRLVDKGKILSIIKGYYLIIPPRYQQQGVLPVHLFLDDLMNHLQRPYYIALINAAAFHGASHQKPQESFVVTDFPVMRPTQKNGLKINYLSIMDFPERFIDKVKTEAGYLKISSPVLTAADLVQFEKRIGGLSRVSTILNELIEMISTEDFSSEFLYRTQPVVLQRLGYLLEYICQSGELSDALFENMKNLGISFYRIPLKSSKQSKGFPANNRWKVIVNAQIEIDE